ncbi:MAG: serine--tRNA ligase [Flavobacteriaceae bacterium]|nr:serine--tRNA ligase [Flavobacteriaceae bacterium]|tara:strand:- start:4893 stop:6161 length:1269 start_codon:yes stop_codon:yes gene_type:complete
MLKTSYIIENKEEVIKSLSKRNFNSDELIERLISIDEKRKLIQTEYENMLAESNSISKEIGQLFKSGNIDVIPKLKQRSSEIKKSTKVLSDDLSYVKNEIIDILYQIPNIPHKSVPAGNSENDNVVIFESKIKINENAKTPHWVLAKKYDLIDFELGTKITGSGFPVYKGKGAKLQRALISFFLDSNIDFGYNEVQVPYLVNEDSAFGTGQLPDKEGQMYSVPQDNLFLIPTAEVPITNIFRDEIIEESNLPIMKTGYSPCFRREAGSYGAHVRGLNRLHQFDKVEIVRVEHPEKSYDSLNIMKDQIKTIIKKLELPFRIITLCGGDLGFTAALTYDFEVYSPAQDKWLEVSSVSNFETFQSNRLKIRYRNSEGKTNLAHTLNGSSLALPRVLATIIENFQTEDGIKIPKVLQTYTGFSVIK